MVRVPLVEVGYYRRVSIRLFAPYGITQHDFQRRLQRHLLGLVQGLTYLVTLVTVRVFLFTSLNSRHPLVHVYYVVRGGVRARASSTFSRLFYRLFRLFIYSGFEVCLFGVLCHVTAIVV